MPTHSPVGCDSVRHECPEHRATSACNGVKPCGSDADSEAMPAGASTKSSTQASPEGLPFRLFGLLALLYVGSGLAYSFLWPPVVNGLHAWATPTDLWATLRDAQWISWGGFGAVYAAHAGLVALPGLPLLLAPIALLVDRLGLTTGFPLALARPSAWYVVGPIALLLGFSPVVAVASLLRTLGASRRRQAAVAAVSTVLCWPVVALWGHPEDAISLALSGFALGAILSGRRRAAAWLLGLALAFQPVAILGLPVLTAGVYRLAPGGGASGGLRRVAAFLGRAAVLPGLLLFAAIGAAPRSSLRALVAEPNFPRLDWATPWVTLAPSLGHGEVAAGPGRLLAVVAAVGLGLLAVRRGRPAELVWLTGTACALRPLLEAVMVPYYVLPGAVLLCVAAASRSPEPARPNSSGRRRRARSRPAYRPWRADDPAGVRLRVAAAGVTATALTVVVSFRGLPPWPLLSSMFVLTGLLVTLGAPGPTPRPALVLIHGEADSTGAWERRENASTAPRRGRAASADRLAHRQGATRRPRLGPVRSGRSGRAEPPGRGPKVRPWTAS